MKRPPFIAFLFILNSLPINYAYAQDEQSQDLYSWKPWAREAASQSQYGTDIQQYDKPLNNPYWIQKDAKDATTDFCRVIRMPQSAWENRLNNDKKAKKIFGGAAAAGAGALAWCALQRNYKPYAALPIVITVIASSFNVLRHARLLEGRVEIKPQEGLVQPSESNAQDVHIALEGLMRHKKFGKTPVQLVRKHGEPLLQEGEYSES